MEAEDDNRFAIISHDPRFRKISQRARKVKIDKRFHGMFKDDNFKLKYTVDKRGRPINLTSNENLRKFYELSSSEDDESSEEGEVAQSASGEDVGKEASSKIRRLSGKEKLKDQLRRRKERRVEKPKTLAPKSKVDGADEHQKRPVQGTTDEDDTDDDSDRDSGDSKDHRPSRSKRADLPAKQSLPLRVDLARGQGNMESSSDSDSDSDSDYGSSDREEAGPELQWGELDRDAPRSGDQSARLALCNMDWDRVTGNDLLVLFNSFKPTGGVIHSVKIYPSEYGLEKMREEDARGPAELVEDGGKSEEIGDDRHDDNLLQEKLRKYQLQRLKYYYAVVDCDSVGTAAALYDHCDGMEYQSSSTKLDLRFIPDDVAFDNEPKEVATELPDTSLYKPVEFRTSALHQSRVELTWDETSHQRAIKTAEAFKKKNVEDMDVSAFLASSSDEDGEERWELDFDDKAGGRRKEEEAQEHSASLSEDQQIAKYRALLREADTDRQTENDKQMEMEITWEPGLKDTAEELVKKKSERTAEATPWEKFLEKKKEKKKKQKGKKTEEQMEGTNQNTDLAFSDDELPDGVDLNDPFFKDALKEDGVKGSKKKKKTKGRKEETVGEEDKDKVQQNKSELELLFMDEDSDGKKHFNLKQIMENEKTLSKKAKRKKRRQQQQEEATKYEDDFQIDVGDNRFQAMFTSHLYAVDPSDPHFKKTKATEALLAERQKRRLKEEERQGVVTTPRATPETTPKASKLVKRDAELSMLIKSVKNKTDQFKERKLKRQKVK
ncbi:ESF1 homolog [Patiria miniata]|uniref:NUC153 domain-containing protein n=1 Tax=Patiria miniata TaxID=46514 RepID=A0A914BAM6_PATMI|nr:ESF1 homolog [Patiria miniata]